MMAEDDMGKEGRVNYLGMPGKNVDCSYLAGRGSGWGGKNG